MKARALELIDFEKIDILLEGFNKTTGFVTAILDLEGNVLSKSGWRQICTDFHRVNHLTSAQCKISDTVLAGRLKKGENYHFYKCMNGLVDVAVPLVINGEHVANLFSGQFFFENPDISHFRKQAKEYGFDEEKYLDALSRVPVISEEKVKVAMNFLKDMTLLISELAFQRGELETLNISIKDSEELFKTVFEAANVGKSITLPAGEINANATFCKMLGYTKTEMKGKKWQDLTPVEEIEGIQERLDQMLKGEKEHASFEKRYIRKDGSVLWTNVNVSIYRDAERKPKFFITTIIDISERKRVEKELLANEERYRSFFINSLDAILLTSPDGTIQAANPAACHLFGKTEEEIIRVGRDGLVAISDSRLPLLLSERKRTGSAKGTLTFVRSDGSRFEAEVSSALFNDSFGAVRTIMIIRDITERINREVALRYSEEKYNKIFQASPDIIILTSLSDGNIVEVNERLETMTGYKREEILGRNTIALNFWVDPAQRDRYITALRNEGKVRDLEVKFRIKSGEIRDTLLSGEVIDLHTGRYILGVIRDITKLKRAEEQKELSLNMFVKAFEQGPAARCITRISDGMLLNANETFLSLFGYSREEVIGHTSTELNMWTPGARSKVIAKQLESGGLTNFEMVAQSKSGKLIDLLFSSKPLEIDGVSCYITTMLDITERKKAESRLKESEERLRLATEQSGVAVWEYDFTTDSMSRSTNHDMLYGLEWQEQWNIRTFLDATHPDDRDFSNLQIQQSVKPGGPDDYNFDFRAVYPDGSVHWLSVNGRVTARDAEGNGLIVRGTITDVTRRISNEMELKRSREELRQLAQHIDTVREQERKSIALNLHDDLGQRLTALKMDLKWLKSNKGKDSLSVKKIDDMMGLLDDTVRTVQRISSELRPSVLYDLGLKEAVEWQINEFTRSTGIRHILDIRPDDFILGERISVIVFRIIQESLTNVARHAAATEVVLDLEVTKESICLHLLDNGKGIKDSEVKCSASFGLIGMRERAGEVNGNVVITGSKGKGTSVKVIIPLSTSE